MAAGKEPRKEPRAPASTLQVDLEEGHLAEVPAKRWKSARRTMKPWIVAGSALFLLLAGVGFVVTRPPAVAELRGRWVTAFESGNPRERAAAIAELERYYPKSHELEVARWHEAMWKGARTQAVLGLRNQADDAAQTASLFARIEAFRPEEVHALGGVVPEESELVELPTPDAREDDAQAPIEERLLDATRRAFSQRLSAWRGLPAGERLAFGAGTAADFVSTHVQLAYPTADENGLKQPVPGPLARGVWDGATCLKEAQLGVVRARRGYDGLFHTSLDNHDAQISVLLLEVEKGQG